MKRLGLAFLAASAIAFAATSAANADYRIVQWSYGDCKIWDSNGPLAKPEGTGWRVLTRHRIETYNDAYTALQNLYTHGVCK